MDKFLTHQKTYYGGEKEYFFISWSIPNVASTQTVYTDDFILSNGCSGRANLKISEDEITYNITIESEFENIKCFVSMFIGSETLLFSNVVHEPTRSDKYSVNGLCDMYDLITLSSKDECFEVLKQRPNETLFFICRIKYEESCLLTSSMKTLQVDSFSNLKLLAATLKNTPKSSLKEKVILRVGEETESVSKGLLCARSPVFAKMFENDMKEQINNTVTVTDIKMAVLKALVSFLFTGKLPNYDFDFLCELYYASDKYDIEDLRQLCVDLILSQISMENSFRVLRLGLSHNDMRLKSTAVALIATNIETCVFKDEWKNLVMDEPKVAVEIIELFDF